MAFLTFKEVRFLSFVFHVLLFRSKEFLSFNSKKSCVSEWQDSPSRITLLQNSTCAKRKVTTTKTKASLLTVVQRQSLGISRSNSQKNLSLAVSWVVVVFSFFCLIILFLISYPPPNRLLHSISGSTQLSLQEISRRHRLFTASRSSWLTKPIKTKTTRCFPRDSACLWSSSMPINPKSLHLYRSSLQRDRAMLPKNLIRSSVLKHRPQLPTARSWPLIPLSTISECQN